MSASRNGEVVVYVALTCIGIAVAAMAVGYGVFAAGGRIGPGFLPLVAGVLLAVLCAVLAGKAFASRPESPAEEDDGSVRNGDGVDSMGRTARQRTKILWSVFGLLAVTVVLVLFLGFIASFGLLILAVSLVIERRKWLPSIAVTLGACGFVYVVFVLFMQIPLPAGIFGT